jgi:hypothetical protein
VSTQNCASSVGVHCIRIPLCECNAIPPKKVSHGRKAVVDDVLVRGGDAVRLLLKRKEDREAVGEALVRGGDAVRCCKGDKG